MSKNCLLVFRNKKINNFDRAQSVISVFAANGIYFDRVCYCAYDDSEEISRTVCSCNGAYENIVLLCPQTMQDTMKSFCEKLFEGQFDNFNTLNAADCSVFVLTSDGESKLKESDAVDIISKKTGKSFGRSFVKAVGVSPADINEVISKSKTICPDCDFNVRDSFSDCTIEMVYPENLPKSVFDSIVRTVITGLSEHVYAMEDITLAQRLFQLLQLRRMKISVAESFTGGGVAKRLVEVPGISEVYMEGLNTYSNTSKMKRLGVEELILKQYGAVSEQTAYQMVEGLLATGDCDIALSTTGIAGPKSDMTSKPVGLLYIGVGTRESISVYKYELKGGREKITETAVNLALFHTFKKLK